MLHGRRRLVRLAAAAMAGAGCLAAASCAAPPQAATAIRAWVAPDPLAGLTGHAVELKAANDAAAARTLVMNGTVSQSGSSYTLDLAIKRGQGCSGTVAFSGKGSVKLTVIGTTVYLNGDKKFWTSVSGANASSAVVGLLNGRYIKVPSDDPDAASLAGLCNISTKFGPDGTSAAVTREPLTVLDGTRVVPLKVPGGTTDYVTDTSAPELFEATATNGTQGTGRMMFAFGAKVTVAAPPASQVIDGAQLGLGRGGPVLA